MQTTSLQRELQRLSVDIEVPNHEERDHHRFPEHLVVDDPEFDALVKVLWEASRPPQDSAAEVHRDYLRSILLNLARGALTRQWTIFSGNSNAYSEGGLMHTLGFTSRRRVGAILELLKGRGWLLKVVGKKYEKQAQANLYWATEELRKRLIWVGLPVSEGRSEITSMVILKLVIHPVATWCFAIWLLSDQPQLFTICVLMAALPTGANLYVLAQKYQVYVARTSSGILASTVLSLGTLSAFFYWFA